MTWTGTGLVRLYEGSALEFNINNIPNSGDYEVILRYEQPVCTVNTLQTSGYFLFKILFLLGSRRKS